MNMTSDARAALKRASFSRRDFLKTSGALVVAFSVSAEKVAAQFGAPVAGSPPLGQLDSWIAIAAAFTQLRPSSSPRS
jgi:hypothetical protein